MLSGWNDKSHSYRFPNGSIDYNIAEHATTWTWGLNFTDEQEKREHLKHEVRVGDDKYGYWNNIIFNRLKSENIKIESQYDRRITWKQLAHYIAISRLDTEGFDQEHHQRTTLFHCEPCVLKYDIITQLENAAEETEYLSTLLNIRNLTNFGKMYEHKKQTGLWRELKKETIKGIYRHYWLDFVLFGYSVEQVNEFIALGQY